MTWLLKSTLLLALSSRLVFADQATCNPSNKCPEATPCCSQYGQCGVGAYCLGGCDPLSSNSLDSCTPKPVCDSRDVKFTNMDRLVPNTKYLGDPSQADFVYSGEPQIYQDQVLLTMPQDSVGTLLTSTVYLWYGKISAKLKTSGGQGVVSAFILLSDVKDEIDFEFVGYNLTQAQTNYFFQGQTANNHGGNSSVPGGNSMSDQHLYEIDWQPNSIVWSIDGNPVRTLQKADTYNTTSNQYDYPQSPSSVQLSLWPAGDAQNAPGTIAWSGGPIQWTSPYMSNGYYYAAFEEVSWTCYDPPSGANETGNTSYIYTQYDGTNDSVAITSENTILKSLLGTGTNMSAGEPSASASGAAQTSEVAQVPGLSGAGSGSNSNQQGGGSDSSGGSQSAAATGAASTGFVQGGGSSGSSGSSSSPAVAVVANEKILQGSIFAALVAVVGMLVL